MPPEHPCERRRGTCTRSCSPPRLRRQQRQRTGTSLTRPWTTSQGRQVVSRAKRDNHAAKTKTISSQLGAVGDPDTASAGPWPSYPASASCSEFDRTVKPSRSNTLQSSAERSLISDVSPPGNGSRDTTPCRQDA